MVVNLLAPGTLLREGRYQIERRLGKGGYGITYYATDLELKRQVAIKEFFPVGAHREIATNTVLFEEEVEAQKESFINEGHNLARVEHPNIPTVYETFVENETAYLVMRFIEGKTLQEFLGGKSSPKKQPLPENLVRQVMGDLVAALGAAHAQGVYHLDIKPGNVMMENTGRAILLDFGAARQKTSFSTQSVVFGTPQYAPLELVHGPKIGPFTDIFELGMMLHELLTGELPPPASIRKELSHASWHPTTIAEPWRTLITEATLLDLEKRPQDIQSWWAKANGTTPKPASKMGIMVPSSLRLPVPMGPELVQRVARMFRSESEAPEIAAGNHSPTTKINPIDGAQMVWIPAGEFLMGSTGEDCESYSDEQPQRSIYLSGYWMYKYPVTVTQFRMFTKEALDTFNWEGRIPDWGWQDDHPMVRVSWAEAKAYCDWAQVVLPTEAQFEKAARGADGRKFPWGDSYNDKKLWASVFMQRTSTASVHRRENVYENPSGCVDMVGNIWHWCRDWYGEEYYKTAPLRDPIGPSTGTYRVLRGGSWCNIDTWILRSAYRSQDHPTDWNLLRGFRASSSLP